MEWILVFIFMIAAFAAACIYMVSRVQKFLIIEKISNGSKRKKILISIILCFIVVAVMSAFMHTINAIICVLYLILFWLLSELVFGIVGKIRKKAWKRYYAGAAAILVTVAYMIFGWSQAHGVWQKNYVLHTDKKVGNIKVVLLSDSHVGTTFDGDGFAKHMKKIQKENPDVVVVAGDFVDDDTNLADMKKSCAALGKLKTKYGVYYVFGNHDKGYYSPERRGYDGDDLIEELTKNNVHVLQDENVLLDNRFYIIGRQDHSEETDRGGSRADMSELTKSLDDSKYQIVLDHQPMDYEAEAESGVDMVLSGHTHGGQLLLLKIFQEITRAGGDDQIYGILKKDKTNFIVTSGISDWAIKFKTGCRSEFVIINIVGRK